MVHLSKIAPECLICSTTAGPRPTAARARTALFPDGMSQNMRQRSVPEVSPTAGSRAQNDGIRAGATHRRVGRDTRAPELQSRRRAAHHLAAHRNPRHLHPAARPVNVARIGLADIPAW